MAAGRAIGGTRTRRAPVALRARTRVPVRALGRRLAVGALAGAVLLAAYLLWFRDSSLVAVKTVQVEGVGEGAIGRSIERALTAAGLEMTTLHVREEKLAEAVGRFPVVASVSADPSFPSTLTVTVVKRRPVGLIGEGSEAVAVAGDGVILRGAPARGLELPQLPLSSPPKRTRLGGPMLGQVRILGQASAPQLRHVDGTFYGSGGPTAVLDGGVELRFGNAAGAAQKWRAAAAVLSDPGLGPLDYVDLSVPGRPAVGGVSYSPPPLQAG